VKRGENIEVAAFVGFHFWLSNVARAETCAMKRYRGGLAGPLTTIQVARGLLLLGDAAEFVDNVPYYCLARRKEVITHNAVSIAENYEQHF